MCLHCWGTSLCASQGFPHRRTWLFALFSAEWVGVWESRSGDSSLSGVSAALPLLGCFQMMPSQTHTSWWVYKFSQCWQSEHKVDKQELKLKKGFTSFYSLTCIIEYLHMVSRDRSQSGTFMSIPGHIQLKYIHHIRFTRQDF
ncbi:hypothetical protein CHARACLAT_023485 [Characodon lateralis]|uniref:Secreted protein n=1 Tax=Characodon lateralis TaxID=208331 RepID=A0ABU7EC85_9TELE|nr:hypothetical protein [Characodon lateralis]